jgi:hypothetical protein
MKSEEDKKGTKRVWLSVWYILASCFSLIIIFDIATGEVMFNSLAEFKHSWTILAFYLAGLAKAIMDTTRFHFSTSIFANKNPKYWNADISSTNKYIDNAPSKGLKKLFWIIPVPVMFTDSWHFFQSIMLNLIVLGSICYTPYFNYLDSDFWLVKHEWINMVADFILLGLVLRMGFYGAYNWFLIKDENRKV